jgi:hypothetical protein
MSNDPRGPGSIPRSRGTISSPTRSPSDRTHRPDSTRPDRPQAQLGRKAQPRRPTDQWADGGHGPTGPAGQLGSGPD